MAGPRPTPRVFSIPAGLPFLDVLAWALLDRKLVQFGTDPLDLSGVTVLLPTRRSVRAFREALTARLGETAAILPVIRPIGDVDKEEHLLSAPSEAPAERLMVPPAVSPLTRQLALTRLTLVWARSAGRHALGLKPDESLAIPGTAADAVRLADDLARLLDDMAIAGKDWSEIATLVPDDHAEYFQRTLAFLRIVSEHWPQYLAGIGKVDPAARRNERTRAWAERIKSDAGGPIIAAGSTGSIPSTALLLKEIAASPNGAVVLPGLDNTLDNSGWSAIGTADSEPAGIYSHPQFGLKQLLGTIGIDRTEVISLGHAGAISTERGQLLTEALRPSETADAWSAYTAPAGVLDGVDWIVARNEQEEALAVALALREAVEIPGRMAALVTPDRTLARRVAVELARWGLVADDSAGAPLDREPAGVFARLLVEAVASEADPVVLVSLLKHPYAAFGLERDVCRRAARMIELALFRGRRTTGGIAALPAELAASRAKVDEGERDVPPARRRLGDHDWEIAATLVDRVVACLGPLETALAAKREISAASAARLLVKALIAAASDDRGSDATLWESAGGRALSRLLLALGDDEQAAELTMPPREVPFFLDAEMASARVQRPAGSDPRIRIWGALEARLQTADLVVLGGLDEGIWPSAVRTDAWLSRAMRAQLRLPPPEQRIGRSAHDFVEGFSNPRVIVSRAEKRGGAPTVESRWMQRIRALVGKIEAENAEARGARYVALARRIDEPAGRDKVERPRPKPPVIARPRTLSITEIEKLIRDPYAIYAKHVLKLDPLDALGREPDAALRGTLIHKALGDFAAAWSGGFDAAAERELLAIAAREFDRIRDYPDAWSVWSIRFAGIARWYVGWETGRASRVASRHAEISGTLAAPMGDAEFTLRGRADRIDLMADGSVEIRDFKTGTPQTERTVFAGLTPQMTLEAAMARSGGFDAALAKAGQPGIAGMSVSELGWLAVGRIGRGEVEVSAVRRGETPDGLAERALVMFRDMVAAFADEDHPYISRARPMMVRERYLGDYDHLARVREWSLIESEPEATG